ncbi:DUF6461 domain-containing protein [Jatrophihabitans endophyticus]|uniref:DUF6461 domain-containing protein n=1 Tax=Jatrophihabitans endophyticus TaxID=1206085 RepID=UPI0019D8FA99|nr:DUF6461 domain-containing protein [Jatrophihabitans endophyticus]MBE7186890.1 hypothetical protein [Jatrophihabitans endophyticus]
MTSPFEQDDFDDVDGGLQAYCLTAVASDDVDAVLDILLPRRRPGVTTWAGARDRVMEGFDEVGGNPLAAATSRSAGWTCVWEDNGFQGSVVRTLTRLSDLGRTISVYRNGALLSAFTLAENRRVVRRFEPLRHDDAKARTTGEPLADEPLLDWSPERCGSAAMTMLANLSGLYPEWPRESDEALVYFN